MLGIHVSFCPETLKINEQRAFSVLPFSFSLPGRKTFEREGGREGASERRGEGGGGRAGRGWEETREAGRLRPGRRAATRTPHAVLAGSHAPAPRARSVRSEDPPPHRAAAVGDAARNFLNDRVPLPRRAFLGWGEERKVEKN